MIAPDLGWRLAYFIGAVLGLIVFVMRMWIPESPRWLMIHGRPEQAHAIVDEIETIGDGACRRSATQALPKIRLRMRSHTPLARGGADAVHDLSARVRWSDWR